MCDFKPGDEVVCVDAGANHPAFGAPPLVKGETYVVDAVTSEVCPVDGPFVGVHLVGVPRPRTGNGWVSDRFRKVQRRTSGLSVESFLTIKPGQFEEPKRTPAPAKKRESA